MERWSAFPTRRCAWQGIAEGRNLLRLHDSITQHRQRFIQEGTDIERGLKDDDAVHIDRILITEAMEEE